MFVELENPAVVQSQTFPHSVTTLHRRIKGADSGLVAMHQLTVDVYNQIAISFVEFLKHWFNRGLRGQRGFLVVGRLYQMPSNQQRSRR